MIKDNNTKKESTNYILIICLILSAIIVTPYPTIARLGPEAEWNKTFGGADNEEAYSVRPALDGGFIVAGVTDSYGSGYSDFYLIKTDQSGNEEWHKTFGGTAWDQAFSVCQTKDGGYIVAGWTTSSGDGGRDCYVIKTDSSGAKIWDKTFGGPKDDSAYSIQQTQDGGYIIAGVTESFGDGGKDYYIIKTDSSGKMAWSNTFGGSEDESAYSVQQTKDGGYIITGQAYSNLSESSDCYMIKTDPSGNEEWGMKYGGSMEDYIGSVKQTTDGGFIAAGYTESFGAGGNDLFIIRTDSSGNEIWSKTFGGSANDEGYSVQQLADGGFIIAGATKSYGSGNYDIWLIRTDSSGSEIWDRTFGGADSDGAYSIQQAMDGGYIVAGLTKSYGSGSYDAYLIKIRGNYPPSASFYLTPDPPSVKKRTTFDASGSKDEDGPITKYSWDFGDGNQTESLDPVISHIYTQIGNYTITLTVTDDEWKTDSTNITREFLFSSTFQLESGYNSMAIPIFLAQGVTAYGLFTDIPSCTRIQTWDIIKREWQTVIKTGNTIIGTNFPIVPDKGYFIMLHDDTHYTFYGYEITGNIMPDLKSGFNLVRIYNSQRTYSSHQMMRENSDITAIFAWDNASGHLLYSVKGFFDTIIGQDFKIEPTQAYLIFCE